MYVGFTGTLPLAICNWITWHPSPFPPSECVPLQLLFRPGFIWSRILIGTAFKDWRRRLEKRTHYQDWSALYRETLSWPFIISTRENSSPPSDHFACLPLPHCYFSRHNNSDVYYTGYSLVRVTHYWQFFGAMDYLWMLLLLPGNTREWISGITTVIPRWILACSVTLSFSFLLPFLSLILFFPFLSFPFPLITSTPRPRGKISEHCARRKVYSKENKIK